MANVLIGGRHHASLAAHRARCGAHPYRHQRPQPTSLDLHATENNWGGNIGAGAVHRQREGDLPRRRALFQVVRDVRGLSRNHGRQARVLARKRPASGSCGDEGSRQRSVQPPWVRSSATAPCCGNAASAPHTSLQQRWEERVVADDHEVVGFSPRADRASTRGHRLAAGRASR